MPPDEVVDGARARLEEVRFLRDEVKALAPAADRGGGDAGRPGGRRRGGGPGRRRGARPS